MGSWGWEGGVVFAGAVSSFGLPTLQKLPRQGTSIHAPAPPHDAAPGRAIEGHFCAACALVDGRVGGLVRVH